MSRRGERRAQILGKWRDWQSHEPSHKKGMIDEFYQWLRKTHPELVKRGTPDFAELEEWLLEEEGWME